VSAVWHATNALTIFLFLLGAIAVVRGWSLWRVCLAGAVLNAVAFAIRLGIGGPV